MPNLTRLAVCLLAAVSLTTASAEVRVIDGLRQPFSVVFDPAGTLYGVEYAEGNRVFQLEGDKLTFIGGQLGGASSKKGDIASGDGGPATKGMFNGMHDLVRTADGVLYIADTFNHRIRTIDLKTGVLDTLAGGGKPGFADGSVEDARFNQTFTVDLHPDGDRLLVADLANRRVREINLKTRQVTTVAGNGQRGTPDDGAVATEAPLVSPRAAIYGRDGSIFIASREGNALRRIDRSGHITTVVNASGKAGYTGDGVAAKDAKLNGPKHLSLSPAGDIVIADDQNHCVQLYRIDDNTIHLVAGVPGKMGTKVGAGPLDTQLNRPHGARYDNEGCLWVCDSWNNRILCFE